ncbi:nicotinamidase/pyrazinamidase [Sphingobacterium nematocida]|uniref:Nicotinamidase n=1 Tax=Sphingobacterium nematocida TaxID=1513896 RepID=A0A1T5D6E0_9SPHI|nr:bifunctional nicotinamidase/pyrazinamidase [Sphingobacterium nematocida]SKB67255.1 nicotinamidase/pyrazinamidase [Sphingobacterium nematocida]
MKALIIVDLQNDFLPGGALEVPNGDQIIDTVNALQSRYDLVIATQDWHPSNHKSFAAQHPDHNIFDRIDLNGLDQVLWPNHCVQGTRGSQLASTLHQECIEAIFRKGIDPTIDSYSGFYDNGRRKNTGLHGYLQNRDITEVHICGLAADFCVYFTAMDALSLGYRTVILSKATKPIDKESYMDKKQAFIQAGGLFI